MSGMQHSRGGLHNTRAVLWLAGACALGIILLPVGSQVAAAVGRLDVVTAYGPGLDGAAKPVQQIVACLWMVLGIGGVLLAFASGVLAPVLAVMLAGVALEVCS